MSWITPPTFTGGQIVGVAAALDILSGDLNVFATPQTWVPTWTNTLSTNPSKGNATITARYVLAGKLCFFELAMTMGSTTTFGATTGAWQFTLPVTARANLQFGAFGTATDISAAQDWAIAMQLNSTTTMAMRNWGGTGAFQGTRADQPFTWATGDTFALSGWYESA